MPMRCEHPFCYGEIKEGEKYIIESESSGSDKTWHLQCYDLFINNLQTDPLRPYEADKIKRDYWFSKRKDMITREKASIAKKRLVFILLR